MTICYRAKRAISYLLFSTTETNVVIGSDVRVASVAIGGPHLAVGQV